jgi:hypothetical protein
LEYAIKRVQANQDGLNLNGTHQLLAYADDVNILGGSVHTVKENAEALVVATKEMRLEVNADKTKYMVMSRERNAGRDDNVKIDNSSIERVEEFKYLSTSLEDKGHWKYKGVSLRIIIKSTRRLRVLFKTKIVCNGGS